MSLQEDVQKIEKKVKKVEEQSVVMELLHDQKKQNKRLFIVILVILSMWFATIGAFLYYINTTGFEEVTEIADSNDGGNACVGDNCNNGEINYGKSDKKD